MKKWIVAALATTALTLPAVAQQSNGQGQQPPASHQQMQQPNSQSNQQTRYNQSQQSSRQQAAASSSQAINVRNLNKDQIKQLQEGLNKKGFDAGNVDGLWGKQTAAALRNFQQQQGIRPSGKLDRQTAQALGVPFGQQGTVGANPRNNAPANGSQNNEMNNNQNPANAGTQGQGQSNQQPQSGGGATNK